MICYDPFDSNVENYAAPNNHDVYWSAPLSTATVCHITPGIQVLLELEDTVEMRHNGQHYEFHVRVE